MNKKREIWYEGELVLSDSVINCYVLRDGTRVLSGREMQRALKMVDEAEEGKQTSGARLQRYLGQKSLKEYIFKGKEEGHFEPIECYRGNSKINGYEATILVDLCDAFLEARNNITLSARQQIIADQCEVLMRSFAKVGIIALVDEATGYQYEREQDALQDIHKRFIAEELQPYHKQFPNEFYREIFRLNGWPYTVRQIKYGERPSVIGKWTKRYIYGAMPIGILDVLIKKTERGQDGRLKHKLFQHLTEKEGIEALKKQLTSVVTLMNVSDSWKQFEKLWNKKYGQQELSFDDYSIIEPHKEITVLSDFNQKLKKGLDYNPKEN
jgi:P63C domain